MQIISVISALLLFLVQRDVRIANLIKNREMVY